jgi:hypothetical protein
MRADFMEDGQGNSPLLRLLLGQCGDVVIEQQVACGREPGKVAQRLLQRIPIVTKITWEVERDGALAAERSR